MTPFRLPPLLATMMLSTVAAFGQADSPFQIHFVSNLQVGDSFINMTNTGTSNGTICVNVYSFTPDEQLNSCCTCPVTPNGLTSLSVRRDLSQAIGLTPGVPTALVVKLLATTGSGTSVPCNSSAAVAFSATNVPTSGLAAWGTTLHALPPVLGSPVIPYGLTETPFTPATLSPGEAFRIQTLCAFIQINGSGFGICRSCRVGGLGGAQSPS